MLRGMYREGRGNKRGYRGGRFGFEERFLSVFASVPPRFTCRHQYHRFSIPSARACESLREPTSRGRLSSVRKFAQIFAEVDLS